jgi:proline iminopeptidase
MNRRNAMLSAASAFALTHLSRAEPSAGTSAGAADATPDPLIPTGVRMAGIRMVPVVKRKHKVWTKKLGAGPLKVLLLHGGPGFSHEYLEAFESFLPAAGIEMYYYDQLGCNNFDQPDDTSLCK